MPSQVWVSSQRGLFEDLLAYPVLNVDAPRGVTGADMDFENLDGDGSPCPESCAVCNKRRHGFMQRITFDGERYEVRWRGQLAQGFQAAITVCGVRPNI